MARGAHVDRARCRSGLRGLLVADRDEVSSMLVAEDVHHRVLEQVARARRQVSVQCEVALHLHVEDVHRRLE